ncbi:unnamed protein product [Cutaneotrichosporon oleaginosum]
MSRPAQPELKSMSETDRGGGTVGGVAVLAITTDIKGMATGSKTMGQLGAPASAALARKGRRTWARGARPARVPSLDMCHTMFSQPSCSPSLSTTFPAPPVSPPSPHSHASRRLLPPPPLRAASWPLTSEFMDRRLYIHLQGGRAVSGILRGFDIFLNLVLDQAYEELGGGQRKQAGMVKRQPLLLFLPHHSSLAITVSINITPFTSLPPVLVPFSRLTSGHAHTRSSAATR